MTKPDPRISLQANPANTLDDLPPNVRIGVVESFDEDEDRIRTFTVYYSDVRGYPLPSSRDSIDDPEPEKYFSGVVRTFYRPRCDAYEVIYSMAAPGWGPLIYDTAIELASQYGGGLMSDRKAVSDAACRVWSVYRARPDVQQRKLPDLRACHPGAPCSTEVAFTKAPDTLKRLERERRILYFDDQPPGGQVLPLPDPDDWAGKARAEMVMAEPMPLRMAANAAPALVLRGEELIEETTNADGHAALILRSERGVTLREWDDVHGWGDRLFRTVAAARAAAMARLKPLSQNPDEREWLSPQGKRQVVAVEGTRVAIRTEGSSLLQVLPISELESEIRRDVANAASRGRAQQAQQEVAEEHRHRASWLGFTDDMPPASRARADQALSKQMVVRGALASRGDHIIGLVKEGFRVIMGPRGRELRSPTGSFFHEKDLTKTGLDFADYLSGRDAKLVGNPPDIGLRAAVPWQSIGVEVASAVVRDAEMVASGLLSLGEAHKARTLLGGALQQAARFGVQMGELPSGYTVHSVIWTDGVRSVTLALPERYSGMTIVNPVALPSDIEVEEVLRLANEAAPRLPKLGLYTYSLVQGLSKMANRALPLANNARPAAAEDARAAFVDVRDTFAAAPRDYFIHAEARDIYAPLVDIAGVPGAHPEVAFADIDLWYARARDSFLHMKDDWPADLARIDEELRGLQSFVLEALVADYWRKKKT